MINVAFVTPGAGVQKPGMFNFIKEFPQGKEILECANNTLNKNLETLTQDENIIHLAQNTNPAVFTYCIAMNKILQENYDIKPKLVAGHSLGEYAAAHIAGYLDFEETLKFLHNLGIEYQNSFNSNEFGMAIITGNNGDIINAIKDKCDNLNKQGHQVYLANINHDTTCAVSGTTNAIEQLNQELKKQKIGERIGKLKEIDVQVPTHSPLVENIENEHKKQFKNIIISNPETGPRFISSVTGLVTAPYNFLPTLEKHLSRTVQWRQAMQTLMRQDIQAIIELSPRPSLAPYNNRINKTYFPDKEIKTYSSNAKIAIELILKNLESN